MKTNLDVIIERRIKKYWGSGNFKGRAWFIGMEEGHDDDKTLEARLKFADGKNIVDSREDPLGFASSKWFKDNPPIQKTWGKIIYIYLFLKNKKEPTKDDIRIFQKEELGGVKSDHALLELMPLPAKSTGHWPYKNTNVEGISSRKEYLLNYKDKRVKDLNILINKYKPKIVIFYSLVYIMDWEIIVGEKFKEIINKKLYVKNTKETIYLVIPHPVARGLSNEDWKNITKNIIRLV